MTSILRTLATTVRPGAPDIRIQPKQLAQRDEDTFFQAQATEHLAKQRVIHASQKIYDHLTILEAQQKQTQELKLLNRSAEMEHTSNNPQLSQPSKVLLLKLMKDVFKEDDNLSIEEFRKRLEAVVLEKTDHFLGFEF